jgi:hypothetical protein
LRAGQQIARAGGFWPYLSRMRQSHVGDQFEHTLQRTQPPAISWDSR